MKQYLISKVNKISFKLPHKLLNDLLLRTLWNEENLGKYKNWVEQGLALNLFSISKPFVIAAKTYAKADIKNFCSCPILLGIFNWFQMFLLGLQLVYKKICSSLLPSLPPFLMQKISRAITELGKSYTLNLDFRLY